MQDFAGSLAKMTLLPYNMQRCAGTAMDHGGKDDMQEASDMMNRLNLAGRRLSKGHRRIAEFIMAHYDKAAFMTAGRLGESVGVSESTVVRFASAMGYDGYPQLQRALQELVSHRLTANQRVEMATDAMAPEQVLPSVLKSDMQNLRATLEGIDSQVFDDVVKRLLSAKAIYVMGLRSAAPLAEFMRYYLNYIFDDVHLVSSGTTDVFEEIINLREEDVLVGISFPRYSTRTLEAMSFARRCGAQVIAITEGPISPLCYNADAVLCAHTDMASFVDSLAAPLSLINALLVALGIQRKEALIQHFRQLESIWDTYQVYLEEGKPDA